MLKQRLITGIVLLSIILYSIFYFTPTNFSVFVGGIMVVGAWEWWNFSAYKNKTLRVLYVLVTIGLLAFSGEILPTLLLSIAVSWWVLACILILTYPKSVFIWNLGWVKLIMGWFVLIPTWYALCFLKAQEHGNYLILFALMVVGAADVGAYFIGKVFGKKLLAPLLSPKKTWEGLLGGLLVSMLTAMCILFYLSVPKDELIDFSILTLVLVVMSVFGDLLESMFKRECGIKDSGKILPGHGGILDRMDSITAALPVFTFFLLAVLK